MMTLSSMRDMSDRGEFIRVARREHDMPQDNTV